MNYESYLKEVADSEYRNTPYQELLLPPEEIDKFAEEHGIGHILQNNSVHVEISELQQDLLWELSKVKLTSNQQKILKMHLSGVTQVDIARKLGTTQPAVHKALHGNIVYSGKYAGKRHGGIVAKLRKAGIKNKRVIQILLAIKKVKNSDLEELSSEDDYKEGHSLIKRWKGIFKGK